MPPGEADGAAEPTAQPQPEPAAPEEEDPDPEQEQERSQSQSQLDQPQRQWSSSLDHPALEQPSLERTTTRSILKVKSSKNLGECAPPSPVRRSITWRDFNGNQQLTNVVEYEPSEIDGSEGQEVQEEERKACCTIC